MSILNSALRPVSAYFGVLARPRSYATLLYLLIGFPLGLVWFVLYVTGVSLGIGLFILGFGAVILLLALLAARPLGGLERQLAVHLLGAEVPPADRMPPLENGFLVWLGAAVSSRVTWTRLVFLLIRFPLGLASWLVTIVGLTVVGSFVFAPLVDTLGGNVQLGPRALVGGEVWLLSIAGLLLLPLVVHALNGVGFLWGWLARLLLGVRPAPAAGVVPAASAPASPLPA